MKIHAFAAQKPSSPLEPFEYEAASLGPFDVQIAITHCGICRSDVHMIDNDWEIAEYPLVPGHEIVGLIEETGDLVQGLERGQRVGIGWQRSACLICDTCVGGDDNLCAQTEAVIVGHHGGFADRIRIDSRFVFPIPDRLPSEQAAPLLCAGATVFSPLITYDVRAPMRTAVVGVGGLGHLAIQFLAAFGCEVVAISHSAAKADEAKQHGAHGFLSTAPNDLKQAEGAFDFILSTVPTGLDGALYTSLLAPHGRLCVVGVLEEPLTLPVFSLIVKSGSVSGSPIAARARMRQMLRFAARHQIQAQTEVFPMREVNGALDRLRSGLVRYRAVLVA